MFRLSIAALCLGCLASLAYPFIGTKGGWFVDEKGRVLILRGLNVSGSSKSPPFLPWQSKEDLLWIKEQGFNCVRYLVLWEAIEPEPGRYDETYLEKVAERLDWLREAGLKVILDMHQDLYSRRYGGDGAPEWACLDDKTPFEPLPGVPWFFNYLSPAVVKAFDSFWANRPGPDGVGIQDRFIRMWQHLASRFKDDPNIIGYDLLNEPFYGSYIYRMMGELMEAIGQELPDIGSEMDLKEMISDPQTYLVRFRDTIRKLLDSGRLFDLLDSASRPAQQFEKECLQPFYDRITAAIREVDPNHIIFYETAGGSMSGTKIPMEPYRPRDNRGRPFQNVALSPHFYDFSSDFGTPYSGTEEYIYTFLKRAVDVGERINVPVWFGEWGTWPPQSERPDGRLLVEHHLNSFDRLVVGWAFWEYYGEEFKRSSIIPLITRPYAQAIAGEPVEMRCSENSFRLTFIPKSESETVIWVPKRYEVEVKVEVEGGKAEARRDEDGYVRVKSSPQTRRCTVILRWSPTKEF